MKRTNENGSAAAAVARALHAAGHLRRQGRHWTFRTRIGSVGMRDVYCIPDTILSGEVKA